MTTDNMDSGPSAFQQWCDVAKEQYQKAHSAECSIPPLVRSNPLTPEGHSQRLTEALDWLESIGLKDAQATDQNCENVQRQLVNKASIMAGEINRAVRQVTDEVFSSIQQGGVDPRIIVPSQLAQAISTPVASLHGYHGPFVVLLIDSVPQGRFERELLSVSELPTSSGAPVLVLGTHDPRYPGRHLPKPFYRTPEVIELTRSIRQSQDHNERFQRIQDEQRLLRERQAFANSPAGREAAQAQRMADLQKQINQLQARTGGRVIELSEIAH